MHDLIYGLFAITLGVISIFLIYRLLDFLLAFLPSKIKNRISHLPHLLPAGILITFVLVYPIFGTLILSFKNSSGKTWVGFENYTKLFSSKEFYVILINNFLWVAFVPTLVVIFGLLVAQLTNQVGPTREKIFKSLIFMPMAISFVSAAAIWKFMYAYVPPGRPEVGLFNAILSKLGFETQTWLMIDRMRLNSFLLMIIIVWLQTGFSMVLLSAAIKSVPEETVEASRIDGCTNKQAFFRIIIPQIRGTIMAVFITVLIGVMKIFDIVLSMTGGNFNTSVLGFEFYKEFFLNANSGKASAIVMILMILIAPLIYLQIRTVRHQESLR